MHTRLEMFVEKDFYNKKLSNRQIDTISKIISRRLDTERIIYCRDEDNRIAKNGIDFHRKYKSISTTGIYLSGYDYTVDDDVIYMLRFTLISSSFENLNRKKKELNWVAKTILNELGL